MNKNFVFSIIVPLYNKRNTVARAIRSILTQSFPDFELIVVDDGSSDGGEEIVRDFSDSRICFIQQENGGVSKARNTGIATARGNYVTFLDADDEYMPDFLASIWRLIEKYPDAGIYGCSYLLQNPDGRQRMPMIRDIPEHFEGYLDNYFEICAKSDPLIWTGCICIRKNAFESVGGFPEGITVGEDLLMWAKLVVKFPLVYKHIPLSIYHLGAAADYLPKRSPQNNDQVGDELIALYKQTKKKGLKRYIAFWYKNRCSSFLRMNKRMACIQYCLYALKYDHYSLKLYLYIILTLIPQFCIKKIFNVYWRVN